MSKYYSYMFYADRNVRPCTILGYTLTTFPNSLIQTENNRKNLHRIVSSKKKGPCIIGGGITGQQVFYTAKKQLNKNKEGGNSQPSKQQEKGTTLKHTQMRRVGTAAITKYYITIYQLNCS